MLLADTSELLMHAVSRHHESSRGKFRTMLASSQIRFNSGWSSKFLATIWSLLSVERQRYALVVLTGVMMLPLEWVSLDTGFLRSKSAFNLRT